MVRVLAVADEVVAMLATDLVEQLRPDLILGAGDLPFDYLEALTDRSGAPCVFVPGNHDSDLSGYRQTRAGWTLAGLPSDNPGPPGAINADGRIVTAAGLRIAGLGGSIRYNNGPNQYAEVAQRRRAAALLRRHRWAGLRARLRRRRDDGVDHPARHGVDILLTHSPARGYGDGADGPHTGFGCLVDLVRALRPQALVHGHIHPYGSTPQDLRISWSDAPDGSGDTLSLNTVGYTLFDITAGTGPIVIRRRRRGA
ncbi:metallophosphoesterase [Williamsia sp. CHRR-6]|uniref:metallophosphoesterase family protein n=1 Tax=Williamsia sp. CHRR-6 TaxID=2835871 RepID=UPI001BDB57AE|nr:metallophosphoesterase [Williamsia sp. CHRR-6]MBT0568459.1 metallophosphoesterase [Williamsia sp. CHRR-6]